uniref:Uncharacterized protein n=1 Tax=Branchiostoma floridae TaxID=7739 RepID=C3Z179_BRAFL|eukprot:XP_002597766.1 hypothetical protein BRAFLDRAFT_77331 [Branchiostoma floridae]
MANTKRTLPSSTCPHPSEGEDDMSHLSASSMGEQDFSSVKFYKNLQSVRNQARCSRNSISVNLSISRYTITTENMAQAQLDMLETSRAVAMRLEPLRHYVDPYVSAWADERYHAKTQATIRTMCPHA